MTILCCKYKLGLLGMIAGMVMVLSGCATTGESPSDKAYDNAISEVEKGYEELDKVDDDVYKNQTHAAVGHFNKALKHFDNAFEDLAKAELPAADQPAIDALKKADTALEKCVNALEDNKIDQAQEYYATAQSQFNIASSLLQ